MIKKISKYGLFTGMFLSISSVQANDILVSFDETRLGVSEDTARNLDLDTNNFGQPAILLGGGPFANATVLRMKDEQWQSIDVSIIPAINSSDNAAIAIDDLGRMFVATRERASKKLVLFVNDHGEWLQTGITSDGSVSMIDLEVDSNGDLAIAYRDSSVNRQLLIQRVSSDNFAQIQPTQNISGNDSPISFLNFGDFADLDVNANGDLCVAYRGANGGATAKCENEQDEWVLLGNQQIHLEDVNDIALAFDNDNQAFVVSSVKNNSELRVDRFNTIEWTEIERQTDANAYADVSVAVHVKTPYISFSDQNNQVFFQPILDGAAGFTSLFGEAREPVLVGGVKDPLILAIVDQANGNKVSTFETGIPFVIPEL